MGIFALECMNMHNEAQCNQDRKCHWSNSKRARLRHRIGHTIGQQMGLYKEVDLSGRCEYKSLEDAHRNSAAARSPAEQLAIATAEAQKTMDEQMQILHRLSIPFGQKERPDTETLRGNIEDLKEKRRTLQDRRLL
jgi:hypothetical protein